MPPSLRRSQGRPRSSSGRDRRALGISAVRMAGLAGQARATPRKRAPKAKAPPPCPPGWAVGPPDFVGVGVQRAGTSWWWNLVTQHPQVHVPGAGTTEFKERQFFSGAYAPRVRERQIERYPLHFPRPPGTITGEWTPRYMYDPW